MKNDEEDTYELDMRQEMDSIDNGQRGGGGGGGAAAAATKENSRTKKTTSPAIKLLDKLRLKTSNRRTSLKDLLPV